jgi:pSer/pThr/pTyr-binding forkhead associated (FHA) protein
MPPSAGPPAGPPPGVPVGYGGGFGAAASGPLGAAAPMPPPVAAGPRRCPQCSNEVPASFRFCGACGFRMDEASGPAPAPVRSTAPLVEQARPQPRSTITLIRPDGSEGGVHELTTGENQIGRTIGPLFENDGYLSPMHAELVINAAGAVVRDLDSLNGVFVKMTDEEEILPGQIIRLGQELLRFDLIQPPEPMPDGTEVMGSPNPGYWGKITVIIGREVDGSAFPLLGEHVTLGRERGEINFPDDGYVSGLHARITMRDGRAYLVDLGSSNGTFLKVNGERALRNESFVLLGQQLFRLNLVG